MDRRTLIKAILGTNIFSLFPSFSFAYGKIPVVKRVRYSSTLERTRIVLDCSDKIEKNWVKPVLKGKVLWLTLKNTRSNFIKKRLKSKLVKEVKVYPINRHLTRVKIAMVSPHKFKVFALKAHGRKPFRLVIDVLPDFLTTSCERRKLPQKVVVIDPGHGGKDPGAIWPPRSKHPLIKEKQITLAISLRVRRILKNYPFVKVIMTRTRDVYVPLLKRSEIAAKSCADAFISIHADSMPNYPSWHGVTVFKASPRLFRRAELLAQTMAKRLKLCNDVMCWSISPLLLNMATTVTFVESGKLAESIVESLKAHVNEDIVNGIRDMQRNILVLKTPGRPAVLIETGFLTNPLDRKKLIQSWYQEKIAKGIAKGIINYLYEKEKMALEYVVEENEGEVSL